MDLDVEWLHADEVDMDDPSDPTMHEAPCGECGAHCTSDAACLAILAIQARWWE